MPKSPNPDSSTVSEAIPPKKGLGLEHRMFRAVLHNHWDDFQEMVEEWGNSSPRKGVILQLAVKENRMEMVEVLTQYCDVCDEHEKALQMAIGEYHTEMLATLLKHAKNNTWRAETVFSAAYMDNREALDLLLPTIAGIPNIEAELKEHMGYIDNKDMEDYVFSTLSRLKLQATLPEASSESVAKLRL